MKCFKCNRDLPREMFKSQSATGVTQNFRIPRQCLDCIRAWHKEWARKRRLEKGIVPMSDPSVQARIAANKEKKRVQNLNRLREWSERNPERTKQSRKESAKRYLRDKRWAVYATNALRRAAEKSAVMKWGQEGIRELYKEAVETGMEVDHIIPLRGKTVCGLHVRNNLQLLSASENYSKGNKFNQEVVE